MHFVLDNSVSMRWLFGDGAQEDLTYAEHALDLLGQDASAALVPGIWALEAANVIARAEARHLLPEARSAAFVTLLSDLPIQVDPHTFQHALGDTLQIARRYGLSSYDAAYLELALREGLPLATLDADLRSAAARAGVALA